MGRHAKYFAVAVIGIMTGLGAIVLAICFFLVCRGLWHDFQKCVADEPSLAADNTATSYWSNVQSINRHQWQLVTYSDDGTFSDPSGQLVSSARSAADEQRVERAGLVTAAAANGLTNALAALVAVTGNVPERAISIGLHIPPGVNRKNLYLYAPKVETDGTNDTFYVSMNFALGSVPKVSSRYESPAGDVAWVEGSWTRFYADDYTVQEGGKRVGNVYSGGCTYYGCKRLVFKRPPFAYGIPVRFNRHLRIGHPDNGFSTAGCMVTVDGYETFTGVHTNVTRGVVKTFQSGALTDIQYIFSADSGENIENPDAIQ
ncbi:MAG: hypothetical protein ACI4Q3_00655 [Kiritimatiellia bacterium]